MFIRRNSCAVPLAGGRSVESGCRSKEVDDLVNLTCRNVTMAGFVSNLRGDGGVWYYLNDNLVVNQTELTGAWDFDLQYSARWKTTVAGTRIVSLFDAIDKLGLKLNASMVPTPVVVVDRVNRTPTPNSADADKAFPPLRTEFDVAAVKPTIRQWILALKNFPGDWLYIERHFPIRKIAKRVQDVTPRTGRHMSNGSAVISIHKIDRGHGWFSAGDLRRESNGATR